MEQSEIPRKIFFWTLFVLFWFVAISIIGYAFGYSFSFERGVFIYTGSITLKTTPQEVDVYIDGVHIPSKLHNKINNSYHITGIKPGSYLLEVKAPGFQEWSKRISVHSGISTEFWNVVLVQKSYAREDYDMPGIQKFFISPRENLAAISQQIENDFIVKIFNPGTLETKQIFLANDYKFTDDSKENIEWSPEGHRIIIPSVNENGKNYFIASTEKMEQPSILKEMTSHENLSHVRWDPDNKDVLFYMSNNDLWRLDLNNPQSNMRVAENISSYDITPDSLFYFQLPEGIIYETEFDGSKRKQITLSSPEMIDPTYQIIVYDEDRIVMQNKSNNLYIFNKSKDGSYFNKLSSDAVGTQFSDDGKKLLFWSNHEISAYFVRAWDVQPARSENEIMQVTFLSDPIENVQWTRDYEHVLFTNNNRIKMIEIDKRDNRNMVDILTLNSNSALLINNFVDNKLYYTEKNDDGQNSLHAIYFPEKDNLFGNLFLDEKVEE